MTPLTIILLSSAVLAVCLLLLIPFLKQLKERKKQLNERRKQEDEIKAELLKMLCDENRRSDN